MWSKTKADVYFVSPLLLVLASLPSGSNSVGLGCFAHRVIKIFTTKGFKPCLLCPCQAAGAAVAYSCLLPGMDVLRSPLSYDILPPTPII